MSRHLNRATLLSSNGIHLRYITARQAYSLVDSGEALRRTSNRELSKGKPLIIQLRDHRRIQRVIATLTERDMCRNAEAIADRKKNRSTRKVEAWPTVHDTFAVTIVAGRGVFVPDPQKAAEREKAREVAAPWKQGCSK